MVKIKSEGDWKAIPARAPMNEETDDIQQLFDHVQAETSDAGFSEQVVSRLALRQKIRRVVLVCAALIGILLFVSQLLRVEPLVARLAELADGSFSILELLGGGDVSLLVFFFVLVIVISNTTMTMVQTLRSG